MKRLFLLFLCVFTVLSCISCNNSTADETAEHTDEPTRYETPMAREPSCSRATEGQPKYLCMPLGFAQTVLSGFRVVIFICGPFVACFIILIVVFFGAIVNRYICHLRVRGECDKIFLRKFFILCPK